MHWKMNSQGQSEIDPVNCSMKKKNAVHDMSLNQFSLQEKERIIE